MPETVPIDGGCGRTLGGNRIRHTTSNAETDSLEEPRAEVDRGGWRPGLHFHDLQHTDNMLAAESASLRELMARMGHSSTRAALIYQHASRDRERAIAAAVSARVEAARPKGEGHDRARPPRRARSGHRVREPESAPDLRPGR